jgi:multiple antibiotic resistance protein
MELFDWKQTFSVSLILFSVIDIVGSVPVLLDLRKRLGSIPAGQATLASGLIMIGFLYIGKSILKLFGVDVASFAIAGSLIIFLIGLEMTLGRNIFKANPDPEVGATSASIVPIAFPIIAGAGTMTTLLSLKAAFDEVNIIIGILVNLLLVYAVLRSLVWIERRIGKVGEEVLRKIFGVILLAIAIKILRSNIRF